MQPIIFYDKMLISFSVVFCGKLSS